MPETTGPDVRTDAVRPAQGPAQGAVAPASTPDTAWFTHVSFGMFLHWGLYAMGARHEWLMNRERMTAQQYERYFRRFDPDLFDAKEWASAAKAAGMRYVVLTTKHHDGFCLWDSHLTDYTVMHTPFGRDVVAEFVAAVREAGLKVGFYHSLLDWHHPDFTIDGFHPQRDEPNAEALNAGRDMARYREYLHGQVRELLTEYGRIDYLFFDFSYGEGHTPPVWGGKDARDWHSEELLTMVRELQPGILVNDRLGIPGDFVTPEQYQPERPLERDGRPVLWEACQTLNGSWGYDRDNSDYKSVGMLVLMLIDGVAKNGNLLLNVGPNGRGEFDRHAKDALDGIGDWMRLHGRSIYGAGASSFTPPTDVRYTQRDGRLYAHLFAWPFETLHLPGLADRVDYAQLLHDGSEVAMRVIDPHAQAQNMTQGSRRAPSLSRFRSAGPMSRCPSSSSSSGTEPRGASSLHPPARTSPVLATGPGPADRCPRRVWTLPTGPLLDAHNGTGGQQPDPSAHG